LFNTVSHQLNKYTKSIMPVNKKHLKIGVAGLAVAALVIGLSVGLTERNRKNKNAQMSSAIDSDSNIISIDEDCEAIYTGGMGKSGKSGGGSAKSGKSGKSEGLSLSMDMSMGKSGKSGGKGSRRLLVVPGTEDYENGQINSGNLRQLDVTGKSGKSDGTSEAKKSEGKSGKANGTKSCKPKVEDICEHYPSGKSGKSGGSKGGKSGGGSSKSGKSGGDGSLGGSKSSKSEYGDYSYSHPMSMPICDCSHGKSGKSGGGKSGKSGGSKSGKSGGGGGSLGGSKSSRSGSGKSGKGTHSYGFSMPLCSCDVAPTVCKTYAPTPELTSYTPTTYAPTTYAPTTDAPTTDAPTTAVTTAAPTIPFQNITVCVCEDQMWTYDGTYCVRGCGVYGSVDYNTPTECCDNVFGQYNDCPVYDMCKGPRSPTLSPTSGSTPTVSTENTGPPTVPDRTGSSSSAE